MGELIVDPTDSNVAILPDGGIGHAVRIVPRGSFDATAPTAAQLNAVIAGAPILGYGRFTPTEES